MRLRNPERLPILPLSHPQVLLPNSRISVTLPPDIAQRIVDLLNDANGDSPLIVGAVPTSLPSTQDSEVSSQRKRKSPEGLLWYEHGCTARVEKIVRTASRPSEHSNRELLHVALLSGIERIRITLPESLSATPSPLSFHAVRYPPTEPPATSATSTTFRSSASKLLGRLVSDSEGGTGDRSRDIHTLMLNMASSRAGLYKRLARSIRDAEADQLPALADVLMSLIDSSHEDKTEFLSYAAGEARLTKATQVATAVLAHIEVSSSVSKSIQNDLSKQQKIFFLQQQQAAIQRQLSRLRPELAHDGLEDEAGGESSEETELAGLRKKISLLLPGSEERKVASKEYNRLRRIPPGSVETSVVRSYLEWLVALPWPTSDPSSAVHLIDKEMIDKARARMDADHYGLEPVKRRIVEHLAVMRLKQIAELEILQAEEDAKALKDNPVDQDTSTSPIETDPVKDRVRVIKNKSPPRRVAHKGPILLLHGPPGVGKTSIAQSLARALDRPFQRISLGGIRDEAEIRGHRRTYVASGPGNIVQALRKAERLGPVILLDEIDKVAHSNFHGDPAAALLEVLDPEQNWSFKDHYINVPIDLSQVLFIATANTLSTISAPLLDRCELIHLPGYTHKEKLAIANTYLIPKQLKANGMDEKRCRFEERCVPQIISGWTREAGVRNLERSVGAVVRAKAVEWSGSKPDGYSPVVTVDQLEVILGPERYDGEERERVRRRGVVYGLVVTGAGDGGILPVETAILPGSGQLRLSGSLGDVIKESAELALSWLKSHAYALGLTETPSADLLKQPHAVDIHIHLPAGAQKKDGPSAGIAMVCALVSLLSGLTIPTTVAMTGEITLRGAVTPVGGIKEKVLGAHRAGIRTVILPRRNRRDVSGHGESVVPEEVRRDIEFVFVDRVEEVLAAAFADGEGDRRDLIDHWIRDGAMQVESRL